MQDSEVREIRIEEVVQSKYRLRRGFDENALRELAASIEKKGIIQPIVVRKKEKGYELIIGERRLLAAKLNGLEKIPAIIKEVDDRELLELALVENIQREDLNPIEEAEIYKRLLIEYDLTQDDLAERLGKDRTTITNSVRLLKLPVEVQNEIINGAITPGHGRALLGLESKFQQIEVCKKIIKQGLSVRETERMVKNIAREETSPKQGGILPDPMLSIWEGELMKALGTKVKINEIRSGKGKIIIEYYSSSDLERIFERLR
ncbi:MAG: ParB/RepB/Spo0J family partition protein [bacterium]|nr:ParB/RepB/Spo0J family partition protein [bacterium]